MIQAIHDVYGGTEQTIQNRGTFGKKQKKIKNLWDGTSCSVPLGNEPTNIDIWFSKAKFGRAAVKNIDIIDIWGTSAVFFASNLGKWGTTVDALTFTDDFSRYGFVYLMKHKSESFEKFKEFKNEVHN